MKFDPKSEEQIIAESLLPVGVYDFEITKAEDQISKAGNEMIHLKLTVYNDDGKGYYIDDYLLDSAPLKLRRAAAACDLLQQYEGGLLEAIDFEGKTGKAKINIQKGKEDGKGGMYADKNGVGQYLPPAGDSVKAVAAIADDGIPF